MEDNDDSRDVAIENNIILNTSINKKDINYKSIRIPLHHVLNCYGIDGIPSNEILVTKLDNINYINQRVKGVIRSIANNFISLYYCWIYNKFLSNPLIHPTSYDITFITKSNGRGFL